MYYKTDTIALKKAMIENGIDKIGQLSMLCNVNRNTLGGILNKGLQPSADVMYKLAVCLKLTPHQSGEIFFAKSSSES